MDSRVKRSLGKQDDSDVKKQKTIVEYSKGGLVHSLHGNIYQLKLLMLFLKRAFDEKYSFQLATEWDAAEKFDDLVFEYIEEGTKFYRFLQAKHKQDESKKISLNDLLTETDGEFSLQKYFISYRKIKQNPEFKANDTEIKDFIICTNIDLADELKSSFSKEVTADNILDERLKLDLDKFSEADKIVSILKNTSDVNRLSRELVHHVVNSKKINSQNSLFKSFHGALMEEKVIDIDKKELHEDFIVSHNLSPTAENFRKLFNAEIATLKKQATDPITLSKLKGKKLILSKNFGEIFHLDEDPQITNINEFLVVIIEAVKASQDKTISIAKTKNVVKNNINKLAGHVLVYEGEDKDQKIKFRSAFLDATDKSLQGVGNLEYFKDQLKSDLINQNISFDQLSEYEVKINDYNTCEEGQQKLQNLLPSDVVTDEDIKDFFHKLVFAVNQPNEEKLGEIIKNEIGKEFNNIDRLNVYSRFQEEMLNWMKDKRGRFVSHVDGTEFFEKMRKEILGTLRFDVKDPVALFTGRDQELKTLHEKLQNDSDMMTVISQIKSISGLGGIGKTELARKYISEFEHIYDSIVWIDAESERTAIESFYRLAQDKLGISTITQQGREKDPKSIIEEVYKFFAKGASLFVFDNAEKEDYLIKILPLRSLPTNARKPRILITSRNREWDKGIDVIDLNELKLEDAIEFVKKGLNICQEDKSRDDQIERLVNTLQRFPLALQQAIAYIEDQGVTYNFDIDDYVKEFEKKAKQLLESDVFRGIDNDYAKTTYTTWQITIDKIRSNEIHGQLSLELLNYVAYFAPQNIHRKIFSKLSADNEEQLRSSVRLLVKYSMLNGEEKQSVLNVHRLVQQVTRITLKDQQQEEKVIVEAFELLNENYPYGKDQLKDTKEKRHLLPHFEAMLSHMNDWIQTKPDKKQRIENEYLERMLTWMSEGYRNLGNPQRQKELLEQALIIQVNNEPESVSVAKTLANLGNAHGSLGDPHKNKELHERALTIMRSYNDSNSFEVASLLVGLGSAYGDFGDHEQKKNVLEQALEINRKQYGPEHIKVAAALVGLGDAYGALGDHKMKIQLSSEAIDIKEKFYGRDHFEVARSLLNISNAYGDLGDPKTQKALLERALPIMESHYGFDHVLVAANLNNLGNAYFSLGNPLKQKELLERAIPIYKSHFGEDHFKVAIFISNLGVAYGALGDHEKKRELTEEALKIQEKHFGPYHFQIARTLNNLALAYGELDDFKKQRDLLLRALAIVETRDNRFEIAYTLNNLGIAFGCLGDVQKEIEYLERALEIKEEIYGHENFEISNTLDSLGPAYGVFGNYQKQKDMLERALAIRENHYGLEHSEVVFILSRLGVAYEALNDHKKQKAVLERAFSFLKKHYGRDHAEVISTQTSLGEAYKKLRLPLHGAVVCRDLSQIKELFEKDVDVTNKEDSGDTALHLAVREGFIEGVKYLLNVNVNKAFLNLKNNNGKTPSDLAIENMDKDPQVYREIIDIINS